MYNMKYILLSMSNYSMFLDVSLLVYMENGTSSFGIELLTIVMHYKE